MPDLQLTMGDVAEWVSRGRRVDRRGETGEAILTPIHGVMP